MRYRLDRCGFHLKLDIWKKLSVSERFQLSQEKVDTLEEIHALKERLSGFCELHGNSDPEIQPAIDSHLWSHSAPPPECVLKACREIHLDLQASTWAGLGELKRYALYKLSLSRRGADKFTLAVREFIPDTAKS